MTSKRRAPRKATAAARVGGRSAARQELLPNKPTRDELQAIDLYDGRVRLGGVSELDARKFEATDATGCIVGIFSNLNDARSALLTAHRAKAEATS